MPGDDLLPRPDLVMDRRIDLGARPDVVWPWIEQLGKRRAGWYLPSAVEWAVPRSRRAIRSVDPSLLGLGLGDEIPDWGPGDPTFEVVSIEPPHHLVYWSKRQRRQRRGAPQRPMTLTWSLALTPSGMDRTDLRLRLRLELGHPAGPVPTYGGGFFDWLTITLLGQGLNERLAQRG